MDTMEISGKIREYFKWKDIRGSKKGKKNQPAHKVITKKFQAWKVQSYKLSSPLILLNAYAQGWKRVLTCT